MTTTINATTTALGGAIVTGDNSGQLGLQGDGVTQITVTNSGVTFTNPSQVLNDIGGVSTGKAIAMAIVFGG